MKIQRIQIQNLKAVDEAQMDLGGCSAIVFGGNEKGKTTLLRSLIDRFRGEKPGMIVKDGETNGYYLMELTDGSQIKWDFTQKTEKFQFITKDGIKQTTGVIKAIRDQYFGSKFDIDKFLNSSPKEQTKELQKLAGIDFSQINEQYNKAYKERRDAKKDLDWLQKQDITKPEPLEKPDVDAAREFVRKEKRKRENKNTIKKWLDAILEFEESPLSECIDFNMAREVYKTAEDSEYSDEDLDKYLENTYTQESNYQYYLEKVDQYDKWENEIGKTKKSLSQCEYKLEQIENKRKKMIQNANIPEGFEFMEEQIYYQGFPLSSNQISSSGKYIAALKLGRLVLGDLQAMHFDASNLDKHSLAQIQEWADRYDLQLLIERPEFDGGDIKYEIVQEG